MRVSIAMATYNGQRFIGEQLQSFVDQTRLPDELVICDDSSTDQTSEIVEEFSRTAPFPVHLHRNSRNLGYSQNFSQALGRTRGKLVFISDQDDVWHPNKIDRVCAVFGSDTRALSVVNNQLITDANQLSSGATSFGRMRRAGFPDSFLIAGSCTTIARPLLELLLPVPDGIPYDSWIGWGADLLDAKRLIEEPLQIYRRHGENASDPNVLRSTSRWGEARQYARVDPRPAWLTEIRCREELGQRLQACGETVRSFLAPGRLAEAIASNGRRIEALQVRVDILARPRLARSGAVLRAWKGGLYAEFNGLASAAKDFLRR